MVNSKAPRLTQLQKSIEGCVDVDAVGHLFSDFIAHFGCNASACGGFLPMRGGARPFFYFQNWPAAWLKIYEDGNFVAHDYGVAEARKRHAPFTWLEAKAARVLSAGEKRVWKAVEEFGWPNGFSVPIHGPAGYFGLVTMASTRKSGHSRTARMTLHMASLMVHDRCRSLSGESGIIQNSPQLSAREAETLRWISAGLTDGEIAEKLGISINTVNEHVEGARAKLKAKTRAQALLQAYLAGVI